MGNNNKLLTIDPTITGRKDNNTSILFFIRHHPFKFQCIALFYLYFITKYKDTQEQAQQFDLLCL